MRVKLLIDHIVKWLSDYCDDFALNGFVVGVSGGIDSAVTSVICSKTGKPTIVVSMPILQQSDQMKRALNHGEWLARKFSNVRFTEIDLTSTFNSFRNILSENIKDDLAMANSRSRIRMTTLYALATNEKMLVVGTGNKVEDFGIGFYTKYGDGGVDLSPIAGLMKSEVYTIAKSMGIAKNIIEAIPTDGLWNDDRSDESQIGATYDELESAMNFYNNQGKPFELQERSREVLRIYRNFRRKNLHKMIPIPVCSIPEELL